MRDVCSLPGEALEERLDWIGREILPHAVETERLDRGVALELEDAGGVAEKVDLLIGLERECCPSVAFEAAPSAEPGRLRLEIRGIDPDEPALRALEPAAPAEPRASTRVATAAGIGIAASLFVCCVVPIAAGALLGAAAAPLAALDAPLPIASAALLGGFLAWWWLGRRARRDRVPSACGCAPQRARTLPRARSSAG